MRATDIARHLSARAEQVCQHLLPNGRRKGRAWLCGSLSGEAGNSLQVCLEGSKAGVWMDFGAGPSGDLIGLWQQVRGIDLHQACEEACDWLNIPESDRAKPNPNPAPAKKIETRAPSPTWLRLQQSLRKGTLSELNQVASLRKFPSIAGLELATRHDHLFFADVWDDGFEWPAWIITDPSRRNAQARRMDGQPWSGIGNKKAKTITGCEANWPVGIANSATSVAFVEGAPDFLAAWHFIWMWERVGQISPVAMLGAGQPIHPEAASLFKGKKIWLFPHGDNAGITAAERWENELTHAGATRITRWDFTPHGVKDLNEFVLVDERAAETMEASDAC